MYKNRLFVVPKPSKKLNTHDILCSMFILAILLISHLFALVFVLQVL